MRCRSPRPSTVAPSLIIFVFSASTLKEAAATASRLRAVKVGLQGHQRAIQRSCRHKAPLGCTVTRHGDPEAVRTSGDSDTHAGLDGHRRRRTDRLISESGLPLRPIASRSFVLDNPKGVDCVVAAWVSDPPPDKFLTPR